MLPQWQYCSSSFPLDPKFTLNQLCCQQSWLLCSGVFVLRLWPSCLLFVTPCWLWDIIFNALHLSYLVESYCFVYKRYMHAHPHTHTKDVQTRTGKHVYLSSSCLERPPPKPIPWGLVLNKKRLWPTLSEFKIPSWQHEAWCVFRLEKQMLSIQISMFSLFLFSFNKTMGKTPGKTSLSVWLWALFIS